MPETNLSGSGILWINSGVNSELESSFSYDSFVEWYEEVHIGDVIEAGQLPSARRYARVDILDKTPSSNKEKPFLVIYDLPDLSFGSSEAFRQIPMGHTRLPGGGPIGRLASFHSVFARFVKDLKKSDLTDPDKAKSGRILASEFVGWEIGDKKETATETATQTEGKHGGLETPVSESYLEQSRYRQMAGWVRSTEYAIVGEMWVGKNADAKRKTVGNTTLIVHEMDAMEEMGDEADGVNQDKAKEGTDSEQSRGEIRKDNSVKESRETRRERKTGSDGMDSMRGEIGDSTRGRRVEQGLFRLVRTWER